MHTRDVSMRAVARKPNLALAAAAVVAGLTVAPAFADSGISSAPATRVAPSTLVGSSSFVDRYTEFERVDHETEVATTSAGRGHGASDAATLTYTGGAGTGTFGAAGNWNPSAVPAADDSLMFGASPAGTYSVTNDLSATLFNALLVDRGASASNTVINGGFSGKRIAVGSGGVVLNGGVYDLTSDAIVPEDGTAIDATLFSLRAGLTAGTTATLLINNGATVSYGDLLTGSGGSTGNVTVTGVNTKLTPKGGIDIYSRWYGAGNGVSNTLIDDHAVVTTNLVSTNFSDTWTISNGAKLIASDYEQSGFDTAGQPVIKRFPGELLIGQRDFLDASGTTTPPLSTMNVTSGGTVNTNYLVAASIGYGQTANVNVNAGTVSASVVYLADPSKDSDGADTTVDRTFNKGTMTISNGGVVNAFAFYAGTADTSRATINVQGTNSLLDVSLGALQMGGLSRDNPADSDQGAGSTDLNITAGGKVIAAQLSTGDQTASTAASTYSGNNVQVSGANSKLSIVGYAAVAANGTTPAQAPINGFFSLGEGTRRNANLSVLDGGVVSVVASNADARQNGYTFVGNGRLSNTKITVDGPGSLFDAGTALYVIISPNRTAYAGAKSAIKVQNGGVLRVTFDGTDLSGQLALGVYRADNASITMDIGGGTGPNDSSSLVDVGSFAFIGGIGDAITPTTGVATTVNINNGIFNTYGTAVYPGSKVNINKGRMIGAVLSAAGGNFIMSATAPAGTGVMISDEFEAGSGGAFDIGAQGGISVIYPDSPVDDLTRIKSLIVAGLNGGANSIKSSLVTPAGNRAIGYALRLANDPRTAFFGIGFAPADTAVLFRTTLKGDANLTGNVNFDDLVTLAQNYNKTGKEWYEGDFTYDGVVNFDDLVSLAQNYNQSLPSAFLAQMTAVAGSSFAADWALAQSIVPEPTSFAALGVAGMIGMRRRRR